MEIAYRNDSRSSRPSSWKGARAPKGVGIRDDAARVPEAMVEGSGLEGRRELETREFK